MKRMILNLPANRVRRNYIGGAQIDAMEGKSPCCDGEVPEDWIASTVAARNPGLAEVPDEGLAAVTDDAGGSVLLRDLFELFPEHYLGRDHFARIGSQLGFLVKLLDSSMRLHVQAHPTAAFAQEHLNSRWGKLETYVILGVRDGAAGYIRLGFQRPPGLEQWQRIVFEQDIAAMDACFDPVPVQPGEVWVVPGGLPHALGEGLFVVEVMEPTDLVVRCEFEREGIVLPPPARFMQRDPKFALRIFDHTPLSVEQVTKRCRVRPQATRSGPAFAEHQLIGPKQTDCFEIHCLEVTGQATIEKDNHVQVGIITAGCGAVACGPDRLELTRGSRFLTAAAAADILYTAAPDAPLTVITCRPAAPT